MKIKHSTTLAFLALAVVFFAGCASTSRRISRNQELFDTFPADVQAGIRAGNVDVGFTPEMVMMALGEPDRRYTRITEHGAFEVWAYRSRATPRVSLGLGIGGGSGRTSVGTSVGVATGGDRADDRVRVVFSNGKVTSVEQVR